MVNSKWSRLPVLLFADNGGSYSFPFFAFGSLQASRLCSNDRLRSFALQLFLTPSANLRILAQAR
jgi:hypothetical protein